ncbi:cell surface protein SprA [Prevotellamassilia timonensis]|uniref:T9SS outer membrane translocon Sov/SprA n=1 Tax=Prevotellamassilia timonensis TaxID=1852370 RepID=UPI00307A8EA3
MRYNIQNAPSSASQVGQEPQATQVQANDTLPKVKKTTITTLSDTAHASIDLRDPENLKTEADYDDETGGYRFGTKLGDEYIGTPFSMTWQEYQDLAMKRSIARYYRQKNAEEFKQKGKDKFDFTDMHFDLGPMNKIFGPGGVRIKTQGSAELKIGANTRFTDNPSLSERNRKVFGFDFDEKINLSLNGKVGDKVNMDFNYNSEATFDFDTQNLKLRYEGKEDEIIKLVEAGNVSMPTNSSLVRGASSLFGVRTDMQFGKLKLSTVVAQKKSASSTVSSKGGAQLTTFEFSADAYDENRHFFLSHYFRDHYDENMKQLPNITSGITIKRIEVWVTNKTGATTDTRNIVGFTDLAEHDSISNNAWIAGGDKQPSNNSNSLYNTLNNNLSAARDISAATTTLDAAGMVGGVDYEKLESARKLSASEYTLNSALGYISLKQTLQTDQVLAVAYEYTFRGQTYQVGEFSSDRKDNKEVLFVKTLKNTACTPAMGNWHLMMKNVYSLGATSVQKDKFKLDIKLLSDTTGVYLSYIPEPGIKDKKILTLVGLDRLDNNNKIGPNGTFDYVEGYTIDASSGRVFFPVVEPFGSSLAKAIGNADVARKYVFQELYDSTRTVAKQIAEKNKYQITGQYKATRNDEIQLGAMNIPRGSVIVTAGGQTLMEGSDYTVDYNSGIVRILNKSILDAGTNVNVSLESNTDYGMQRKTMFGMNFEYDFSKDFQFGGTFMHLGEKPITTKVSIGAEPLNNTLWGLNLSWKKQSQRLTDWLNKLPFIHCTTPSSINFSAEFAQLIAGKSRGAQGNASYIDDFENSKSEIDISNPKEWNLSSVPSMFPESKYTNDVRYGYNRALLAWYYIDPLFTRRSSSLTPSHIKNDLAQISDPDVREIYKSELFPNKSVNMQESNTLNVLNLAYYPNERGPYNLDPTLDANGHLLNPEKRWGGMMRKLETSDFEAANIEYIEFWMLDPFMKAREAGTTFNGDLYFNLGEISEDVLKDGKKFYESGLPIDDDPTQYTETVWGRVPTQNTVTYAFNTSSGSRAKQDVGFNGLSSENEKSYPAYAAFLAAIQPKVRPEVYDSILMSPSADKYHYFRGSDYDREQRSILDRYKYINNPNGNSVDAENSPEKYSTAYKTQPDVEDINQDFTLNEYEKYYQYRVHISEDALQVGQNYIVDKRVTNQKTRDGKTKEYTWYQFRIPVDQYEKREGGISDFSSIRFMRMFMTGFSKPVVLRFATLNLVHGEWRSYEQALYQGKSPEATGTLEVSAVNFEENNAKEPVNYIMPPGISRVVDPGQTQILQNNEQALSLTVKQLGSGDARAVYKNTNLDLRRYKHIQMFTHANSLIGENEVEDGQTAIFVRLGSDYKSNFYEYEIPLKITPAKHYNDNTSEARIVWPNDNMLDIDLTLLTNVKNSRNKQKALGLATYAKAYSEYDPERPANKVTVMGNPSLGEVRTIMIGVRNNSRTIQNVEVWANELRLQQFTNKGGWAARSQLNIQLSDLATVNLTGHIETEGFGGLEETVSQRRDDNLYEYSVTTNVNAGKLLPEKVKLNAPIYYSYSKQRTSPRYNPLDTDMELKEALDALSTKEQKDSLKDIAENVIINKNFSISGARFNISTKSHPMPYDPANFTFGYAYSTRNTTGETTAWEKDQNWKYTFNYNWAPNLKTFEPFKKSKSKSKWFKILKDQGYNFLPQNIGFNSDITRSYYELQERDMENLDNKSLPLSWSSDFLWNRTFQLRWDLTKNIHANFSSGTNAEIEQPYTAVNKDLYPDRYTAWKDSVWQSIKHLGRPLTYQQNFDFSWKLPLNKLPLFDWLTADAAYNATYNWARGSELEDGSTLGNTIANSRNITGNGRINFETLYNHVPFLKKVNRKYAQTPKDKKKGDNTKKNFQKELKLLSDTTQVLQHNQRSKKLRVTALRPDGTRYPIRYKVVDNNKILILSQDTARIKITVTPKKRTEDNGWYKALQMGTRFLMMVRNVSVNYANRFNMNIPGFMPQIGDVFGQGKNAGMFAPGLNFAFGATDEGYVRKAAERGWLLMADSVTTPATSNLTESLQLRATLEPFRDVKIDLNASRNSTRNRSIQFMFDGMPTTQTGSFSMTTISIGSAFEKVGSPDKGYKSKTFSKFVSSLDSYQARVEKQFTGAPYPANSQLAGQTFDPANGTVSRYAPEVMIPAFLNTYTAGNTGLDIFPAMLKLLPNWSITYGGLSKLPKMKKVFKSFNLNHSYKSVYSVGSYNTYTSYQEYMNGFGFVNDVTSGNPIPSCMYDVTTVSINESFSPLIGIDMTFQNNLTAKVEMRKTRVLTLSMTSQQLTETRSNDFVVGLGYKIADLNLFAPKKTVRSKSKNSSQSKKTTSANRGFANDLNLRLDFTFRNQSALNRDILTQLSQATSGNKAVQVSFSADYALSKLLTLTAYYDRQMNKPLLTSSSYPVTTQDFGVSIKFILNR